MTLLTLLITIATSFAVLINGFHIAIQEKNKEYSNMKITIFYQSLAYMPEGKPVDFYFNSDDELVIAKTNKIVHVLKDGSCIAVEKKWAPANSETKGFNFHDGIMYFNGNMSFGIKASHNIVFIHWYDPNNIGDSSATELSLLPF